MPDIVLGTVSSKHYLYSKRREYIIIDQCRSKICQLSGSKSSRRVIE